MAIGQDSAGGLGSSGIMQRSIQAWQQKRIADAQEEANRQKEQQAKAQQQSQEQKKPAKPASESGLNTPSAQVGARSILGGAGVPFPVEQRVGAGVGGSTGRVTHYDPSKAPPYLDAIAEKYGINRDDFKRMAWIESRFDPNARAGTSSAGGLFQFLDSSARAYGLANKFDGPANAEAAARMWNDNKAALSRALGREPTGGELYLAHQQGPGGAIKLLTNPNAAATTIVGGDAVRLNGGNGRMSAGEFASLWTNKFSSLQAQNGRGDGSTPRNQDAGNMASPVRVASNTTTAMDASPAPAARPGTTPSSSGQLLPTDPRTPAPEGYFWDLGKLGDKPKLISRATGQDMAGQSIPSSATTPQAPPAATTPGSTTPASGQVSPAPTAPIPPSRSAEGINDMVFNQDVQKAGDYLQRHPDALKPKPQPQPDTGKGIGGFFDGLFGNGEPIKDQYGRTWDGFEGWVDPKAKAETAKPEEAKAEEKGILDGLFGGADSGPDLFSGEMGIFSNLAKLFS